MPNAVELVLNCGSWQEAQRIVDRLMEQRLIANAEFVPVASQVKLIMLSMESCLTDIEAEIKCLHGSQRPVLKRLPQAANN